MSKIGETIAKAREEREMSQADLAKKTKISQVQISRIEGGEIKNPSFRDVEIISKALSMPLDFLVSGRINPADSEARTLIGKTAALREVVSIPNKDNFLIIEGNDNNAASQAIIERSGTYLILTDNQIRKSLGLKNCALNKDLFTKERGPKRTRSILKILKNISGEADIQKINLIENEISKGDAIGKINQQQKLKIDKDSISLIEKTKGRDFKPGQITISKNDLETLINFQLALDAYLDQRLELDFLYLEIGQFDLSDYLAYLLEEASALSLPIRLITKMPPPKSISKYFPRKLFIQTETDELSDAANQRLKKSPGSEGLMISSELDQNWVFIDSD